MELVHKDFVFLKGMEDVLSMLNRAYVEGRFTDSHFEMFHVMMHGFCVFAEKFVTQENEDDSDAWDVNDLYN